MISVEEFKRYTGYFHDGSLTNIKQLGNKIELFMKSAEVDPEEIENNIPLSYTKNMITISGKLIISNIKHIFYKQRELEKLEMKFDKGSVYDFELTENKVLLHIIWRSYFPKPIDQDCVDIEIEAGTICWEPIPELENPFW